MSFVHLPTCVSNDDDDDNVVRLIDVCVGRLPTCVSTDDDDDDDDDADVVRLVDVCVGRLPTCVADDDDRVDVVSACLLTSLRLLLNITHDNSQSHVYLLSTCLSVL